MSNRIFISYRREDSAAWAGRLYDQLAAHFDPVNIFMDVDDIAPGIDFVESIENAISKTNVLVVIIGPAWLDTVDTDRGRRIDHSGDFVRIEISAALKRNIRVIPVLINRAAMPRSTDLPDDIKSLARRNAINLNHSSFRSDAQRLIHSLEEAIRQAEADSGAEEQENDTPDKKWLIQAVILAAMVIAVLSIAGWLVFLPDNNQQVAAEPPKLQKGTEPQLSKDQQQVDTIPVNPPLPLPKDAVDTVKEEKINEAAGSHDTRPAPVAVESLSIPTHSILPKGHKLKIDVNIGSIVTANDEVGTVNEKNEGVKEPVIGDTITEDVTGIELVYVPKGCFEMGSITGDSGENPVHEVCVDGYWIGKYEVTQGQWFTIMGDNPAKFQKGDDYPVESVSWEEVQWFIFMLHKKSGKQFRLPTEAEWEYACLARGNGPYCGGKNIDDLAWHTGNSNKSTHQVGTKQENDFGLFDMSGNVWEWCQDWYGGDYYSNSPRNNPQGPASGSVRVVRSGSWYFGAGKVLSVNRDYYPPNYRKDYLGFRLVLPVGQ